jgi:hypothetical protein
MSALGSEPSAGGLEAQRPQDGGCAPIETWRAVIVSTDYRYQSESLKLLPAKCKKAEDCVQLQSGERGISMGTKQYPQGRLHRVYLVRYGTGFYGQYLSHSSILYGLFQMLIWRCDLAAIPETHLTIGVRYRPLQEKLAALSNPLEVSPLSSEVRQWSQQGTILDQYVRILWLGIRAQRAKLESLGLHPDVATRVFDNAYFFTNVDKITRCRSLQPLKGPIPGLCFTLHRY